jgi:predicted transcriptional regulator
METPKTEPTGTIEQVDKERAAYLAAVDEGLSDLDAGRSIPYELVRRWLLSWGTDNELPPPECP